MKPFHRFFCAVVVLAGLSGVTAFASPSMKVESTPVPIAAKPDMSSMKFLIGTWTCTDVSSRRPAAFTTTEVYSMDPDGYWVNRESTIQKGSASWIPRDLHSHTKYGWDPNAKLWDRIGTDDRGNFEVATAPMPVNGKKTYTFVAQSKTPGIASYAPEVFQKVSDTKKTMTTSFTETNGRVVTVKETCIKSP